MIVKPKINDLIVINGNKIVKIIEVSPSTITCEHTQYSWNSWHLKVSRAVFARRIRAGMWTNNKKYIAKYLLQT